MLTMRQLCIRALRKARVVSEGRPTAEDYDFQVAMETVLSMYAAFIANGRFGPTTDVIVTADYTAGENERVVNNSESDVTITLPATIEDDSTGTTVTRPPEDRSFVLVSGPDPQAYLYDADLAEWVTLGDLTADSNAPLSGRFAAHLISILAGQLCDEYGSEIGPVLANLIQTGNAALKLKRPRRVSAETAVLRSINRWNC